MLLVYKPDGAERREWEFDPDDAWSFEAEMIESVGPWVSFTTDYLDLLRAGNTRAKRALLWVHLRRDKPDLRFVDVVFKDREVVLGPDKAERKRLREQLEAGDFNAAQRDSIEALLADYPDDDVEQGPGKDEPGGSGTSSP